MDIVEKLKETLASGEKFRSLAAGLNKDKPFKVTGLGNSSKPFFISPLLEKEKEFFLIIVSSQEEEDMFTSYFDFIGFRDYEVFPTLEISPYEHVHTDINLINKQFCILDDLLQKKLKCVITRTKTLSQKLLSIKDLKENVLTIRKTQEIPPLNFTEELVRLGYTPASVVEKKGEFSRKGSIMRVFPIGHKDALRIDWFDDEIESIRWIDMVSNTLGEEVEVATLYPASKIVLPRIMPSAFKEKVMQKAMDQVVKAYSKGFTKNAEELRKKTENDVNNITSYKYDSATFSYFNYLYNEAASLVDYLPENTTMIWTDFTSQNLNIKKFQEHIEESYRQKLEKAELLDANGLQYIDFQDTLKKSRRFSQLRISTLSDMPNVNLEYAGTLLPVLPAKFDELVNILKKWKKEEQKNVLIVTAQPQRALTIFRERDCEAVYGEEVEAENTIRIIKGELKKGFSFPDLNLVVITDSELFGWAHRPVKKKTESKQPQGMKIHKVQDLKTGDFIVHETHGIGQYQGLRTIELNNIRREYFEIIYAKGDKLLVPIEQINLISLYRGTGEAPPRLSKMGGAEWEQLKNRVKASIKDIASDLIELYAKRKTSKGFAFPPDTEWQGEMEDAFPYEETPDQLQAIYETKMDMEKITPMDRLICGDVGFGKTEVAIRAIFKAVMSGKQVAVLAPTTVLSQQLYDVLHERFAPYPVKLAILNRFRTAKESKQIYEDLKKGNVDVVVSTHKILMKTPEFFDLGLVVIDEEHKFGVVHKERLKQFKTSVDVLTMSATPIPRTLHMSLSGARDMSLIETPPRNRLPVITKLARHDKELIRDAILQELERGGQIFYVHNRVHALGRIYEELTEMLPDLKIGIGHGQLPEHELENVMLAFNNREYDLLLCTTIVESGLDIPNANTIIIDDVHLFGLAQLYQLRGRVGRTDRQAFAYLIYPANYNLTDEARERLQVMQQMNELGSGYQVAMRDMEIRGVGDLLGAEQSGYMFSVGYDTYSQILEEAVNELKPEGERTSNFAPTVVIDMNIPCYIPDTWIENYRLKMQSYRRLAVVQDLDLLEELKKELVEQFGEMPAVTENLFKVAKIRVIASKLGIKNIKSINKTIKVNIEIPEKDWRSMVTANQDLMRWQWSLNEISTRASTSPEGDLILLEKFLVLISQLLNEKNSVQAS